jgi:hypothetical protein
MCTPAFARNCIYRLFSRITAIHTQSLPIACFIDGKHTGWRTVVIYTFVEQVRRHGADLFAYFGWVFEKLMHNPPPEPLGALFPAEWIKTQPAAHQTAQTRITWEPSLPHL